MTTARGARCGSASASGTGVPARGGTARFARGGGRPARLRGAAASSPPAPTGDADPEIPAAVHARAFAADRRPIILFDGECNLCNNGVNFILDFDSAARLRMAALQSDVGRSLLEHAGRRPDDISSIVLVEEGGHAVKSEAILRIGQLLDMPFPVVCSLLMTAPAILRDGAYDAVADNRYSVFGRSRECRLWDDRYEDRFVA